jgi:hypothetical protein
MIVIRPEQLEAFSPVAEADFERRVAEYLRESHPGVAVTFPSGEGESKEAEVKALDDETLLRMVRTGIARARSYGMTWESSITAFVVLTFIVAPNFDDHPLINRFLTNDEVEPDARVDELVAGATEGNWVAAKQGYDAGKWGLELNEGK